MPILILLLASLVSFSARAEIPPDALQMLGKLPGKRLSVEFVLAKAYVSSDSIRAVKAQAISMDSAYWLSLAATDARLYFAGEYAKNQNNFTSLFEPLDRKTFTLGISKYFKTGTDVKAELIENRLTYAALPNFGGDRPLVIPPENMVSRLTVSQNLWKDGFGNATRSAIAAGAAAQSAARLALKQAIETWALELIKVYYAAWFSQTQLKAAKTNLERRNRLLNITRVKLNRGTSERPDYLQVESALLQSRAAYQQSAQDLQQTWRDLVTSLKLPTHWTEIPSEHIPLALDEPEKPALTLCAQTSNIEASRERSTEQLLWRKRAEAAQKTLAASRNRFNPELKLTGIIGGTGVDPEFNSRTGDALTGENPQWSVGLNFNMPLEWNAEKAQLARDAAQNEETEAGFERAKSNHVVQWVNGCARLKTLIQNREALERSVKNLAERSALEERRFQFGRTSTLQVITAGDEYSNAEVQLSQTRIALNQTAWDILKLNGAIEEHLVKIEGQFGGMRF